MKPTSGSEAVCRTVRHRVPVRAVLAWALLLLACSVAGRPLPVRGWLIHTSDADYLDRVLAAAPRYGINHLDLSHDFVDRIDDLLSEPGLASRVERTARRAKAHGIRTFVWSRELNTRQRDLVLDPSHPEGRRFWNSRDQAYREALRRCPSVAGVVLMFGSSPTEVWDAHLTDAFWTRLSWAERVRFVTDRIRRVVCAEMNRELWVRDFNHGPRQLQAIVDGLRNNAGITVYSKDAPQDFQLFYPHSFSIGAFGQTPQVLELDLNGEYWGQSVVPVSLVRYLRYRIGHGARKGVRGAVGRIDTYRQRALGSPSEVNLYAMSRLLADPTTSEQSIYDGWLAHRYGLRPGTTPARSLQRIFERTLDFAKSTYYTLGFWTPKNQSSMPASPTQIESGIVAKSTALWDPRARDTERRLLAPDPATVQQILAEKARGVHLADQNLREVKQLRDHLKPVDFADLQHRLVVAARVARLYEAVARAYWTAALIKQGHDTTVTGTTLESSANDLIRWADRIDSGDIPLPDRKRQAANLRRFAQELRKTGR